ncbi:HD domain-containing protein [Aquibacillus sp. 3ASR75-11]|uniref:HD domain-containing protein n=1 Tax=Terrihalobacillus insolitus TaxID=2950438 RepID=A0A9X4AKM1_9BACI|nr:HD domain-containing phosphohydrolase [Terrihalobacillus insolitus]MDC3412328.1 HD domain-containing protein [Terrihalobacillus insolitus]MDC3422979.1 HD domain-containing protein [Terrihalobacillus insolitus]
MRKRMQNKHTSIVLGENPFDDDLLNDGTNGLAQHQEHVHIQKIEELFFQNLAVVGREHRYGQLLQNNETIALLKNIYIHVHQAYGFHSMTEQLKNWDSYAYIHSFDVFVLGTLLAKKHAANNLIECAAGYLFHDIGKLMISQEILHKNGKLTFQEFDSIKRHTLEGASILDDYGLTSLAPFARSHHERLDGSGYPDRHTSEAINLELRILMIVDVYSALTLKRPYKDEIPAHEALQILIRDAGKFDSFILSSFIHSLNIYHAKSKAFLM